MIYTIIMNEYYWIKYEYFKFYKIKKHWVALYMFIKTWSISEYIYRNL